MDAEAPRSKLDLKLVQLDNTASTRHSLAVTMPRKTSKRSPEKTATSTAAGHCSQGCIVFFHPDLGIGGAERLVVDAAVGLQDRGHKVVIFTNHCDKSHCFDECRNGTLDVRVRANRLVPPSILSRFTILCAILRHFLLLLQILLTGELASLQPRAFIVDQLSAGLPMLRLFSPGAPILFYCHFPDLLLARGRESAIKRAYRVPFDFLEQWTMGFARVVAVNSNFTKGMVTKTWPRLEHNVKLEVVYPCVDTEIRQGIVEEKKLLAGEKIVLSINRFERKKDIGLAIKAFAAIPEDARKKSRLILAGGYDPRISENVEYHTELQSLAESLSLSHHTTSSPLSSPNDLPADSSVLFLLSIPGTVKEQLLSSARLLVYTPSNEHFGIVPLEAMLAKLPVLAANTGGPVETIVDAKTGWLRDPGDVEAWTSVMMQALDMSERQVTTMGGEGRLRVKKMFSRGGMAEHLDNILSRITSVSSPTTSSTSPDSARSPRNPLLRFLNIGVFFALGLATSVWMAKNGQTGRSK